ncbi:MAG TPA: TetR/AcrR family transcriptional regulator [Jatrophihabitans sp.]|jgi:AcrR family transcriptional regulator|nr:TetR/AcrR family transcriptional regulator [Jatrophihabitans sp.]
MADMAPATPNNEARRIQMLRAAAELICERGFGETRIADVAKRAKASSALVIYYFGTRERLLVDALRYSEQNFYDAAEKMLAEVTSARERLSLLVQWTCIPDDTDVPGSWGLWFDLWAQAFRHPEVKQDRVDMDGRWRAMIVDVVKAGQAAGDIRKLDARAFAVTFAALLDGLSIQVALRDPELDSERAYNIAMHFAERELGLPAPRRRKPAKKA